MVCYTGSLCELTILTIHDFIQSLVLLALLSSPPQPAGLRNCNAAAFASFKKFADAFFESRLRRYRSKRCGLCSYWWKLEAEVAEHLVNIIQCNPLIPLIRDSDNGRLYKEGSHKKALSPTFLWGFFIRQSKWTLRKASKKVQNNFAPLLLSLHEISYVNDIDWRLTISLSIRHFILYVALV